MSIPDKRKEFRDSYTRYYPLVFSVLYSKLNKREDTEDICQEVFIKYYNNFETIENARNWLLTALRFEINNYYRKKTNREDTVDIDDINDSINVAFENGFRDSRIILHEAIENMENFNDEKEKVLFDLIALYDFTYKEAAKYLGMTKSQAEYKYTVIEKRIVSYLQSKNIKGIDDLL
jgi:RNA polymerase sigma factor (sigma-70 family)